MHRLVMYVYKDLNGIQDLKNVICVCENMEIYVQIVMNFNVHNVLMGIL